MAKVGTETPALGLSEAELRRELERELIQSPRAEGGVRPVHAIPTASPASSPRITCASPSSSGRPACGCRESDESPEPFPTPGEPLACLGTPFPRSRAFAPRARWQPSQTRMATRRRGRGKPTPKPTPATTKSMVRISAATRTTITSRACARAAKPRRAQAASGSLPIEAARDYVAGSARACSQGCVAGRAGRTRPPRSRPRAAALRPPPPRSPAPAR